MRPEPKITPDAKGDIFVAVTYYNEQRLDLGYEFLDEVTRAISRIRETPLLHTMVDGPIRRVLTRRFPYGVFYVSDDDCETVVAVIDLRRDPKVVERAYKR
jgi:hypothetical protein